MALGELHAILRDLTQGADAEAISLTLRPTRWDYDEVFVSHAATVAMKWYEAAWSARTLVLHAAGGSSYELLAAGTEQLARRSTDAARAFEPEWRDAVKYIRPTVIVYIALFSGDDGSVVSSVDGLIRLKRGWRWFPRPYVALGELVPRTPSLEESHLHVVVRCFEYIALCRWLDPESARMFADLVDVKPELGPLRHVFVRGPAAVARAFAVAGQRIAKEMPVEARRRLLEDLVPKGYDAERERAVRAECAAALELEGRATQ